MVKFYIDEKKKDHQKEYATKIILIRFITKSEMIFK